MSRCLLSFVVGLAAAAVFDVTCLRAALLWAENHASTLGGITNQSFSYTANDWLVGDLYDANGNTRTNGANVFFYDVENRLTNAIVGGTNIIIVYDGDGNRVRKIVGTTTNTYLVCRQNLTGYAQVLEERVNGALTRVYTYGLDLISQRDVPSGTTLYFGYDGLGSTRLLTTTNGAVANVFAYDAFGTLIASNAAPQTDYLFTGEQRDPNLGFYYLRGRYLNPGTGRFWTRDTHPGNNQDPLSLHRYLYAHADPMNRIDPSGHMSFAGTISVGGIWGGWAGVQLPAISGAKVWAMTKIGVTAVAIGVTLTGHERPQQQNAMRLQLQEGHDKHYWSQVMIAPANPGVTRRQVQLTLAAMFTALQLKEELDDDWDPFMFTRWETDLWSAIIRMSARLNKFGPVSVEGRTVMQEYLDPTNERGPRIDLENLRGTNLRQ